MCMNIMKYINWLLISSEILRFTWHTHKIIMYISILINLLSQLKIIGPKKEPYVICHIEMLYEHFIALSSSWSIILTHEICHSLNWLHFSLFIVCCFALYGCFCCWHLKKLTHLLLRLAYIKYQMKHASLSRKIMKERNYSRLQTYCHNIWKKRTLLLHESITNRQKLFPSV